MTNEATLEASSRPGPGQEADPAPDVAGAETAPGPATAASASSFGLSTVQRLRDAPPPDRLRSWLVTLGITALAFVLRLIDLGYPRYLIFDETYYPKDAWSLLKFGYEKNWPDNANAAILAGNPNVYQDSAAFVVHPPLGKWLIAVGEAMFGMNSIGWRFSALVFGTLLIMVTIRLARRLSRSTLVGALAGILLTFDGLAFTMSRIGLLDGFQAFFLVAAVAAVVADRDYLRHRLADLLDRRGVPDLGGRFGPMVWWRPWRWVAGAMFGAAMGCKWNSIYLLAAFGVLSVLWDVGARRLAGAGFKSWLALVLDGPLAVVALVLFAVLVYGTTWTGWLVTTGGYDRTWGELHPDHPMVKAFGAPLASLFWYHKEIYEFHTGSYINGVTHPYDANPAGWLFMIRPLGLDAVNDIKPGTDGCQGPENCIRVISAMGTPVLWWMAVAALVVAGIWWLAGRDWRFGVPLVAVLAGWLPWFQYTARPLFFFYAIILVPFTATALAMVMGLILGDARAPGRRRSAVIVGVAVAAVLANFAWIYPLLTDGLLPYSQWVARLWLASWA